MTNGTIGTIGEYTPEQVAIYDGWHERLLRLEEEIPSYERKHVLIKGSFARKVLEDCIPEYIAKVPEDVRAQFGFDVEGLIKKVTSL